MALNDLTVTCWIHDEPEQPVVTCVRVACIDEMLLILQHSFKPTMKLSLLTIYSLLTTSTSAIVVPDINEDELIDRYSTSIKSDQDIIDSTLKTLYSIGNDNNSTDCQKCKDRLFLGKSLALTKPELIPTIWTQWCTTATKQTFDYCQQYYARNTVVNGNSGTNFANLLSLMDPASLDSDYWCHLKEDGAYFQCFACF
ncbi:unnamed protein product [Ambrosiozyma monospora]|uniref:Unnamed protein product n=1 Tax=Ambrosiozyma monospora TaxID=43982 RepID=A0ACB5UCE5_AMBMO|nr:unnamed protein product [Ambrosiozyma monospora]